MLFRSTRSGLLILFVFSSAVSLPAQWTGVRSKDVPRNANGKVNLSAPPLKKPDGHPDLTGIWKPENTRLLQDISEDMKPGDLPMQPWAAQLTAERRASLHASDSPDANCLPQGVPKIYNTPDPFKIVQEPDLIAIIYESFGQWRQIHIDRKSTRLNSSHT